MSRRVFRKQCCLSLSPSQDEGSKQIQLHRAPYGIMLFPAFELKLKVRAKVKLTKSQTKTLAKH